MKKTGSVGRDGAGPESDGRLPLGREGEARAAAYLAARGYRIEARNVRADGVELDLVVSRGRLCVVVEVKTRRSRRLGAPELAVDRAKRERLSRGARGWLREQALGARRFERVRFDVVTCEPPDPGRGDEPEAWRIVHLEAAFDASE